MFLACETLSLWVLLLACLFVALCSVKIITMWLLWLSEQNSFISLVPEPRGTVSEPFSHRSPHRQANTGTGYREEAAGNTTQGLRTSNPSLGHSVSFFLLLTNHLSSCFFIQ